MKQFIRRAVTVCSVSRDNQEPASLQAAAYASSLVASRRPRLSGVAARLVTRWKSARSMGNEQSSSTLETRPSPPAGADACPTAVETATLRSETDDDEILLLTLREVFVYQLRPRTRAEGYVASSWGLDKPLLTGYVRVVGHGEREISIAIWQRPEQADGPALKASSAAHDPAAGTKISSAPGALGHRLVAVGIIPILPRESRTVPGQPTDATGLLPHELSHYLEPTIDSSRYYGLRVGQAAGRTAVIGIGFRDRQASFDLRSAIDDYLGLLARQRGVELAAAGKAGAQASSSRAGTTATTDSIAAPAAGGSLLDVSLSDLRIGPLAPSGEHTGVVLSLAHLQTGAVAAAAGDAGLSSKLPHHVAATYAGKPSRLAPPRQYAPAAAEASSAMQAAAVAAAAAIETAPPEGRGDDDEEDSEWAEFAGAEGDRSGSSSGEPVSQALGQQPKAGTGAESQPDRS